jgi:hypothetical protein
MFSLALLLGFQPLGEDLALQRVLDLKVMP